VAQRTCIVILELAQGDTAAELGVMVDNVSEVLSIAAGEIEPAPAFGNDLRTEFIAGVAKVGDRFVILLDVNLVLSVEELAALVDRDHAGSAATPAIPRPGTTQAMAGQPEPGFRPVLARPSHPKSGAKAPIL
jgi:hypothetical protein